MPRVARFLPASAVVVLGGAGLVAGCGGGSDYSKPATAAARTTPATASSTPDGAVAATGGAVTIDASEFAFSPTAITAEAGKLDITLADKGRVQHELVVLKTDRAADALEVDGDTVSASGVVGEIGETDAGATKSHVFDLAAGSYVFVCNLPGHYADGMRGTITVR